MDIETIGNFVNKKPLVSKPRETLMTNMYMSDYVISLTRTQENPKDRFVKVLKNRNSGKTGRADPQLTIELCCHMIAMSVFGDTSMKLFRTELEELIKQTIMKKLGDSHDPFQ
jgi:hypothetical protein